MPLAITTSALPDGRTGAAYSATLAASGGTTPYTWAVTLGALPAGLSLSASTGVIDGTPTGSGTSNFVIAVTDSAGSPATASAPFSIALEGAVFEDFQVAVASRIQDSGR